jgi:hypothetical protein
MTIPPAVPAEFRGLARQLYQRACVEDDAFTVAFNHIAEPVIARLLRHPFRNLRDGTLATLAEQWEALSGEFRIAMRSRLDRRGRSGDIIDIRIRPVALATDTWEELALDVKAICLDAPMHRGMHLPQTIASIGFHAIARRFQRCSDHSDWAIKADMAALVLANVNDEVKYPTGKEFRIPTPRGAWLGITRPVGMDNGRSSVHFVVRTFLDKDA